jgi:hypothetical protein
MTETDKTGSGATNCVGRGTKGALYAIEKETRAGRRKNVARSAKREPSRRSPKSSRKSDTTVAIR